MSSAPGDLGPTSAAPWPGVVLDPIAATRVVPIAAGLRLLAPDGAVLGLAEQQVGTARMTPSGGISQPVAEALRARAHHRRAQAWEQGRVLLSIDDAEVRSTVHQLLEHAGGRPVDLLPAGVDLAAADGDVVVLARLRATGPPEDAWDRGPLAHLPRVRAHREGDQVHILPLALGSSDDVTVRCVCSRRLAASTDREALASSWALKAAQLPLPVLAAQRVAHLLLEQVDLLTVRAPTPADIQARALARRTLLSVDLSSLRTARRSVLPVPAVAPHP